MIYGRHHSPRNRRTIETFIPIVIPTGIWSLPLPIYDTPRGLGIMQGQAEMYPTSVEVDRILVGNSYSLYARFVRHKGFPRPLSGVRLPSDLRSRDNNFAPTAKKPPALRKDDQGVMRGVYGCGRMTQRALRRAPSQYIASERTHNVLARSEAPVSRRCRNQVRPYVPWMHQIDYWIGIV